MSQLEQSILSQAQSLPEGVLLSPKEFLHMGSRAAIDQTLSRLAKLYMHLSGLVLNERHWSWKCSETNCLVRNGRLCEVLALGYQAGWLKR